MDDRAAGLSNADIAKKYNLSTWTIRHYRQEIAAANGVHPDSLCDRILPKRGECPRQGEPVRPIDIEAFQSHFAVVLAEMERAYEGMKQELLLQEELLEKEEMLCS